MFREDALFLNSGAHHMHGSSRSTAKARPLLRRCARLLTNIVLLAALFPPLPALAQGPNWELGEVDDCQRKDIASDPRQHRWWKDAAPVELYEQVLSKCGVPECAGICKCDESATEHILLSHSVHIHAFACVSRLTKYVRRCVQPDSGHAHPEAALACRAFE